MGYQPKPGDTGSLPKIQTGINETQYFTKLTSETDETAENSGKVYLPNIPNGIDIIDYIPYGGVYERPAYEGRLAEDVEPPPDPEPGDPCNLRDIGVSYLYPVSNIDSLDVSHFIESGDLIAWPIEGIDISHASLSGSLVDVLLDYTVPTEAVDVSHVILSGVIVNVLLSYVVPPEGIDISHVVLSGVLLNVLILYSNWPAESLDISHAALGGSLV